jgi:hypothetical protein
MSKTDKDLKSNKNKVIATVIIVIAVIFLVGIIITRAYNLNQSDSSLQEVSIPEEEVILPTTEGNIEHIENAQLKDNEPVLVDNTVQEQATFKNVVNKSNESGVTNGKPIEFRETSRSDESNSKTTYKKEKTNSDYYEEPPIKKAAREYNKKEEPVQESKSEVSETVTQKRPGFGTVYNNSNSSKTAVKKSDLVKSVIHADQSLGNGQSAIIRITSDMTLSDGTLIPKNSIMYGVVDYGNDRVHVTVRRVITTQKKEMNVNLEVYDNDYIKGIYYQTEIDKGVDKGKDESGNDVVNDIASTSGNGITKGALIAGKLIKKGVTSTSETLKKNRKIKLEEGYILYVKEIKKEM